MAETVILTSDEMRAFWPISINIADEVLNPFILRAQQREIKPFLGEVLYFDMLENIADAKYVKLLAGGQDSQGGYTVYFAGVKALLASFAYSQFILENPIKITRAGNKTKTGEFSTEIDRQTTQLKATDAKAEAVRLQAELDRYLDNNRTKYTLWRKGQNLEEKTQTGFSFSKVPRSIQR